MITEKERSFIQYWEQEREKQSRFTAKIINGLPMAIVFGLPIILFVLVVYLWFPDWYAKISGSNTGSFIMAVIAVLICILFFSYFRMHFKWEMNEQLFLELKQKEKKAQAADV